MFRASVQNGAANLDERKKPNLWDFIVIGGLFIDYFSEYWITCI